MKSRLSEQAIEILGEGKDIILTEMLQGEQKVVLYELSDSDGSPSDLAGFDISVDVEYFRCSASGAGKTLKISNLVSDDSPPVSPTVVPTIIDGPNGIFSIKVPKELYGPSEEPLIEDSPTNLPLVVLYIILDAGETIRKERYCVLYRHSL